MITNIMNYLNGVVRIRIQGTMPEKFINLCLSQHIFLWQITKCNEDLIVSMRLADFFRIRPLVRRSRTNVSVITRYGWPFTYKRIMRRKMLVAGACLFLFVLNFLANYIWFVDIVGLKQIPIEQIKSIAYENGLKPGVPKEQINVKTIEHALMVNLPEVAWLSISFTGTRAVIEVVEKTMAKQEDKAPAHIMAGKDGVITEIIAVTGRPAVKKGDTVKKGDLLIKGFAEDAAVPTVPGEPPIISVPPQLIKAQGIVKARVWYESYGEAYLMQSYNERTGNQLSEIAVIVGDNQITLKKAPAKPYELFEIEEVHKKLPWWRNSGFTVESNIIIYNELRLNRREITAEQARDEAAVKALSAVQQLIPESAQILSRNIEILKVDEPNLVRIKVNMETIEDIGQTITISR